MTEQSTVPISFTLNGAPVSLDVPAGRMLLDVLREDLGLTGSKRGCDTGACGCCSVLVDGRDTFSCTLPMSHAAGKDVTTIEGLAAPDGTLDPVQQAFIDCHGFQCGICTSGFIMGVKGLLNRNPTPTREEILDGVKRNLCRCTGYEQIVEAVQVASGQLTPEEAGRGQFRIHREGGVAEPMRIIGRDQRRHHAEQFVTGAARYTDDYRLPGMLYGATVRGTEAHARLLGIDASAALAMPGVVRVMTAADIPGAIEYGKGVRDQTILARDKVRYRGEAIAIVLAETEEQALAAVSAVKVRYEPLPASFDPAEALLPGAEPIHGSSNLLSEFRILRGEPDAALAGAAFVVEETYQTPPQDHLPLELEAAVAWVDEQGVLQVVSPGQHVFADMLVIMKATRRGKERVRVRQPAIGASYGKREDPYAQIHAAVAAHLTGRPVRIQWTRTEGLRYTTKRTPLRATLRMGLDAAGRILSMDAELLGDAGAYASWSRNIMRKAGVLVAGPYRIPNVRVSAKAAYTNNPMSGPIRGFGAVETAFCSESLMDLAAKAAGLDPLEFRKRNLLHSGDHTATGQLLDGPVPVEETLVEAAKDFGWSKGASVPSAGYCRRGIGIGTIWYGIGFGTAVKDTCTCYLEFAPGGGFILYVGTVEYGNGSNTTFPMLAAEVLGCELERVDIVSADTAKTENCGSTVASKQTFTTGNAVLAAAQEMSRVIERVALAAGVSATDWRALDSAFSHQGVDRTVTGHFHHHLLTSELDPVTGQGIAWNPMAYGTQIAEVEVDLEVGKLTVLRMVAAHYVGRVLNPVALRGQVLGGLAMGWGFALREDSRHREGVAQADTLGKYRVMRSRDLPDVKVIAIEDPDPNGPFGAIGIGEPPTIPTAAAIANAVTDAIGVAPTRLPLSPEYLRELIRRSEWVGMLKI